VHKQEKSLNLGPLYGVPRLPPDYQIILIQVRRHGLKEQKVIMWLIFKIGKQDQENKLPFKRKTSFKRNGI
jgi:hypothetical protein